MTEAEKQIARERIDAVIEALTGLRGQGSAMAEVTSLRDGKMFEVLVLVWLFRKLTESGYTVVAVNGTILELSSNPGSIDTNAMHFDVMVDGDTVAKIWNNVQFLGTGYSAAVTNAEREPLSTPLAPDYHELDIAVTMPEVTNGLIPMEKVLIAIECKDRRLDKGMLRQVLGLRRELSFMRESDNGWESIPIEGFSTITSQSPPSRLFLCSSHPLPDGYDKVASRHVIHVRRVCDADFGS